MGATRKTLITIEKVVDHDCGNYRVGEIDYGLQVGMVDDYLKQYGHAGKNELVQTLSFLIYDIQRRFHDIPPQERGEIQACEAKK